METKILQSINLIRRGGGANLNLFRYAAMVLVLLTLGISNAWAGGSSTKVYATASVQPSTTGRGKVYVGKSTTNSPSYQDGEVSVTNSANSTSYYGIYVDSKDIPFYCYAQVTAHGYYFKGWSDTNSESATPKGTTSPYTWTISTSNTSSPGATKTLYALFVPVAISNPSPVIYNSTSLTETKTWTIDFTHTGGDRQEDFRDATISSISGDGVWTVTNTQYVNTTTVRVTCTYTANRDHYTNSAGTRTDEATLSLSSAGGESTGSTTISVQFPEVAVSNAMGGAALIKDNASDVKSGTVVFPVSYAESIGNFTTPVITKTSGEGTWAITDYAYADNKVTIGYSHTGDGTYSTRASAATITLSARTGGAANTFDVTADYPALAIVDAEDSKAYTPSLQTNGLGVATFYVNHADGLSDFNVPTEITPVDEGGTWTLGETTYTQSSEDPSQGTVVVNYTYNSGGYVGTRTAELILSASSGATLTLTLSGVTEPEATNDASVSPAGGSPTEYATFAEALDAANDLTGSTLTLLRNVDLGTITTTNNISKAMTIDLNGKELRAAVNATSVGILTITAAVPVTIKDSKTGGKIINEIARNSEIRTIFVNKAGATLTLESGTIAVNNLGQYASAANADLGVAKYANCAALAINQCAGSTVNINGGRVEALGTRNAYGIYQESSVATNNAGTSVLNISGGEVYAEAPYGVYGINGYGKINFSNGDINVKINTNMVDACYAADHANNTKNGLAYGILVNAYSNATASKCYFGTLNMTGGNVNVTNERVLAADLKSYGVLINCSNADMGSGTAVDGSKCQKAAAKGSIDGGTITVNSGTYYSFGVYMSGCYNSYDNTSHVLTVKNCAIDVKAHTFAYGVFSQGAVNTTNGGCYNGDIELTNCTVTAETTVGAYSYAAFVTSRVATIYKNASTAAANYYHGEYGSAGKLTINSGTYKAYAKTTTAYCVSAGNEWNGEARAKTTYADETNVALTQLLGGNVEAYPTLIIHGGDFYAETYGTTTARAVSSGGYTTIDGGTFKAVAQTNNAYGLVAVSGTMKATGITVEAEGNATVYGVLVNAGISDYTLFDYAADVELNNCDVTATTRTGTEARGVSVVAATKTQTEATREALSASNKNKYYNLYQITEKSTAGKVKINGGTYRATAATTTAYGAVIGTTAVSATGLAHASAEGDIKNAKFIVKTNGTTTAYGVWAGGPTTIDGCDITVQPQTSTAYGIYANDQKTAVTNTKIDVKGTATAHGFYANAQINGIGWDLHGEFELGEGNDITVAATGGDAAHVMTLIAAKKNIASGDFAGDYANAASAHVTGGTYKATATGAKSYVLNLSDQQVQGDVISRPACIIEDGKFWALASGGTTGICSANGQIGHIVLKGGFYNVNTNLAKYKEEGKNVNDVLAGTPEYTEGYRYKVTSELSGAAVCKVYQSSTLKAEYATLEEALQYVNANTGTNLTIVMVADYTLKKGDYILPSNATLVIPKELSQKAAIGNTPSRSAVSTPAPVQFLMLTFDAGVNMTVKGTIETSAVNTAANGGSAITGAPTGNFGRLHMVEGSTMTLESGANLNCWGYTTGKGEINALNGSTVREGFQLGYWRGGTATSSMLNNRNSWHAFPVTDYFIQNVEAPITFRPGAQLLGYSGVNVSIVGIQAANNVKLVGTSASMFLMEDADASEDTYVRKEYDPETDRAIWTVNSGAKIGSFSFSLAGNTVNSADYYLPISNNMTIYVNEGEFTVTQDALLIPGAQVIISKLGKLTVASGKRLFVMDNEDWPGFQNTSGVTTRWYYNALYSPSWTTNPRTLKYPPTTTRLPDAEIFVQGETEGSYYTSTSGANIHSTNDDAGKVKFVAAAGADNSIQHVVNTDNNRVQIDFTTAQLKNELESPNEYTTSKGTVAGEAFIYMEKQWVKVTDGCLTTRTDGSGTHYYAKPSDAVEVVENGDNAYRDVATGARYFINAEKPLTNDECVWWEVEPVTSGTYAGDYMANQPKYDNYGAYYYYDATSGYWKPRYVTVTWKNQDGSTLATYTNVMCNTSPKYLSASPTWANTSIEKHDWVGWRDADGNIYDKNAVLPVAQGNVTYTAYYNVSKYEYTIKFVNPDKTVIWAGLVEAGTIPECPIEPTQAPTVSTVYTFTGWNTTPVEVTGTATYTAVYSPSTRKYHVTFYNYDAQTVLYEADVDYNFRPFYAGVTPFRANTSSFSYEWTGWQQGTNTYDTDDDLAIVTGNVNYIAIYSQTDLKYQVFFKRQDGSIIDAPLFNYEETPAAFPANPTLASTVSTDYTFHHWDPAKLVPVTEEGKVYTAYFSESLRQYTAHFVNYDGKTLGADQTIDYNAVPAYTGATPFKPNDSRNSFEFSGWAWAAGEGWEAGSIGVGEAFPAIKGDITFTAQFTETLLQFNVRYIREDGTPLKEEKLKWGQSTTGFPSVSSYEDETYSYTFDHWNPAAVTNPVTADATYTAYFNQAIKTYSISNFGISPAGYGTISPASLASVPHGSAVTVNGNKITVNGTTITATPTAADAQYTYEFDLWNNVPATVTANVTNIEAVFTRKVNQYEVTFNMKGHGAAISSQTKDYGSKVDQPADPSEVGYTFVGWYKEDACTNAWNFASNEVTGATTLYAKWTVNSYTITFDSKGGSAVESITQDYGTDVTAPADPTREGYTFNGWNPAVPSVMPANNVECVASWTVNTHKLAWNFDGGTPSGNYTVANNSLAYGSAITYPTLSKTGYTFAGWSSDATSMPDADLTITASWTVNTHKLAWNFDGGTPSGNYTEANNTLAYGSAITYPTLSKTGYTFAGWSSDATSMPDADLTITASWTVNTHKLAWNFDGGTPSGAYTEANNALAYGSTITYPTLSKTGYTFAGWSSDATSMPDADLTITASWTVNTHKLAWNFDGGTPSGAYTEANNALAYGSAITYPTLSKTGYTFAGWSSDATSMPDADLTITASWTVNTHKLAWNFDGGTPSGNYTVANNSLAYGSAITYPTLSKTGYTFAGWSTNVTSMPDADLTITANWTVNTHKLAWNFDGGTPSGAYTEANNALAYGSTITYPTLSKTGYTFAGWSSDATSMPDADLTITASWTVNTHKLAWNFDGGTPSGAYTEANNALAYGSAITYPTLSKTGYTFAGWSSDATSMPDADLTITASWTVNTHKLAWNFDGGTPSGNYTVANNSLAYGSAITYPTLSKTGYTFAGWSTNATSMPDADLTITASWTPILYTITWLNDDGSLIETTEVPYDAMPTHEDATKAFDGCWDYTFDAWEPAIELVTGPAEYKATFTKQQHYYNIRWQNLDEALLRNTSSLCKDHPAYPIYYGVPTYQNGTTLYVFKGWKYERTGVVYADDAELPVPEGDEIYTAQYDAISNLDVASEQTIAVNATVETTTVHVEGNLTITNNNELTTTDLILEGTPNTSGQITGEGTLTATRAYFHFSNGTEGFKAKTWYAVAVPWQVDVPAYDKAHNGVYIKKGNGSFVQQELGRSYDLIYYDGARRATGANKAWQYVEDDAAAYHIMVPGRAYMIYLTSDADTIRFERKEGAALLTSSLETKKYEVSQGVNGTYADWNGIANPATYHAYLNVGATENIGQIYVAETKQYKQFNMRDSMLVVGQPIFVQPAEGTTVVANSSTYAVSAPCRAPEWSAPMTRYELMLAPSYEDIADRIIVLMDEEKEENAYVVGQDLVKMGVSNLVPQMWIDRYDSKMCVNTVAPINNTADYPLGISVQKEGEYDLFMGDQPNDETMLYLTYDGEAIWNLSYGGYVLNLTKGTDMHYGLRIVVKAPQITTGIEETTIQNGEEIRKVLVDDKIYIIRNGEIYSIDGRLVNE